MQLGNQQAASFNKKVKLGKQGAQSPQDNVPKKPTVIGHQACHFPCQHISEVYLTKLHAQTVQIFIASYLSSQSLE